MGYSTEQFYNLVNKGVIDSEAYLNADGYSNPAFIWPGGTRKHSENGKWVDKQNIQRGFIRMLTQTKGGTASEEMKKRRCFFQFNPSTITRSVEMRSEMMHPLLQNPSEFSVPMPGNSTFAFELMFDRSFEMNKGLVDSSGVRDSGPAGDAPPPDPLLTGSAETVGVLADLRMLDTIVGQGITADMMNYIIERGEIINSYQTSDTSVSVSTPEPTEDSDSTTTDSSTTSTSPSDSSSPSWNPEQVKLAFEQNVGNQAFLMPTPVRIVFSSLFMVDGFVTSMAVTFVKFNEAMVPMQCGVSIQMQALYIGFAKKDTYLTYALAQAETKPIDVIDSTGPVVVDKEAYNALSDLVYGQLGTGGALKNFKAIPSEAIDWNAGFGTNKDWDSTDFTDFARDFDYTDINYYEGNWDEYSMNDEKYQEYCFPGFCGKKTARWNFGFEQPANDDSEEQEDDLIWVAFRDRKISLFEYRFSIEVTRPGGFSDLEKELGFKSDVQLMLFNSGQLTASTAEEWNTIRRVNGIKKQNRSDLTNIAWVSAKAGRTLNIKEATGSNLSDATVRAQWNKYVDTWLASNKFKVYLRLSGSIKDFDGNELPLFASNIQYFEYAKGIHITGVPKITLTTRGGGGVGGGFLS